MPRFHLQPRFFVASALYVNHERFRGAASVPRLGYFARARQRGRNGGKHQDALGIAKLADQDNRHRRLHQVHQRAILECRKMLRQRLFRRPRLNPRTWSSPEFRIASVADQRPQGIGQTRRGAAHRMPERGFQHRPESESRILDSQQHAGPKHGFQGLSARVQSHTFRECLAGQRGSFPFWSLGHAVQVQELGKLRQANLHNGPRYRPDHAGSAVPRLIVFRIVGRASPRRTARQSRSP